MTTGFYRSKYMLQSIGSCGKSKDEGETGKEKRQRKDKQKRQRRRWDVFGQVRRTVGGEERI